MYQFNAIGTTYSVGKRRLTVVRMEKYMQAMVVTVALLTQNNKLCASHTRNCKLTFAQARKLVVCFFWQSYNVRELSIPGHLC